MMRGTMKFYVALGAALSLSGCMTTEGTTARPYAAATLVKADGSQGGTAAITTRGGRSTLRLIVSGMAPGVHGVHLHAVGKCAAADFSDAGPHVNPTGRQHGSANPAGTHLGDLPNISIDASGSGTLVAPLPVSDGSLEGTIFDADGTAVVVHAALDDYRTDPSGNSGARIACGVLTRG